MELKSFYAQDVHGNILPNANCYVYQPGTQTLATGLKNADNQALTNPFTADSIGLVQFRAPNGSYDVRIASGIKDTTLRNVPCFDPADGGAAVMQYTPAGTGAVATTVQAKLREAVSVLDFGADPTGAANCSGAFANACAVAKKVYVPAGTYKLTASSVVPSNTEIYGDGSRTIIQIAADGVDAFTTGAGTSAKENITIRDLLIDGGGQTVDINTGYKSGRGIYATRVMNLKIDNVVVRKMGCVNPANPQNDSGWGGYGIFITSRFGYVSNVRVSNCTVYNIAGGGVEYGDGINIDAHQEFVGASYMDVVVRDCWVSTVGRHCYTVGGGAGESIPSGVKFINCYGEHSACDFLDIEEGYDVLVDGCTIASCGNDQTYYNPVAAFGASYRLLAGIATGNTSKRVVINNCTFRGNYYGVTFGATDGLTVSNCSFSGSTISDIQQGLANGAKKMVLQNCLFESQATSTYTAGMFDYNLTGADSNFKASGCVFASRVRLYGLRGGTFENCTFQTGVQAAGGSSTFARNKFLGCVFTDYAGAAIIAASNTVSLDNSVESCTFLGAGNLTTGVQIEFNSTRRWQINNNTFIGLTNAGVQVQFGSGAHFFDARGNNFVNCANGFLIQQATRDLMICDNTFSGVTNTCIRFYDISSSLPMPLGPTVQNNRAVDSCVNGLEISIVSGGTFDYTMLIGNNMHNCTGTKWSVAGGNNANGVVANNITT